MKINIRYSFVILTILLLLSGSVTNVFARQDETRKYDEYGKIRTKDENARLDGVVLEMKSNESITVYIISYGGRRSRPKDAQVMANRAKSYIAKKGKFKSSRIVVISGGYKEEPTTEIWIVPSGAAAPQPSPSVDPSEVVPPKVIKKSKSKKRKS